LTEESITHLDDKWISPMAECRLAVFLIKSSDPDSIPGYFDFPAFIVTTVIL
jgi:hypothetical protein